MIVKEQLLLLLQQAVQAPSGDNSQPWRFTWREKDQLLSVYNIPSNDNPIFNYKQRGSLIAHGALLENLKLLSQTLGYQAHIELQANSNRDNLIATITFKEGTIGHDLLASCIDRRCTNRKPYQNQPLTAKERETLLQLDMDGLALTFATEELEKKILADAVSTTEQIMLRYKPLHDYFFQMIRWTSTQEQRKGSGLYVKTMELLPPQLLIFKLYSFWPIARILNRVGLPAFIAKENAKMYRQASAFMLFTGTDHTPESYIKLGSVLQRVWLTATSLGLHMQPVTGIIYLYQRFTNEPETDIDAGETRLVTTAYKTIADTFHAQPDSLRMLLRIGHGEPPSARAQKQIPAIQIL